MIYTDSEEGLNRIPGGSPLAMAIFVVLSDNANAELGRKIAEIYPENHYQITTNQWLISADKIVKEVVESLGAPGAFGRIVVFKVDTYFGYHATSLWEWLTLKTPSK